MNRLSLLSFLLPATICFAGPIVEVGGITFQQVFKESKGSESLHEYLPPGEKLDSWTKLVAFREFSKPREPKAYIENLATVYRKKFPHMQFAVFQDVSMDETTSEGAARETVEEAGAQFDMQSLFSVLSVPKVGQVHLFYRAKLTSDQFDPGYETQEAKLFTEAEIPWDEIAFRTVKVTLERFFADRAFGVFGVHQVDIL